jgi:hypothetical protein
VKINFNNYLLIAVIAGAAVFGRAEFQISDLKIELAKQEVSLNYLDQKVDGHATILGILKDRNERGILK